MRTGLIAEKIGMSRFIPGSGVHHPVTLLQVAGCTVTGIKSEDQDGYTAVQIGFGDAKPKAVAKPQREAFAKKKLPLKRKLKEFRVSNDCVLEIGQELSAEHFVLGQYVDVQGTSIGKGFAGAMKRHNFGGLEATHGVSISHRSHGSTGQCQDPGKVFKGKKMAGHLGDATTTVQNLEIVYVDEENGIVAVKGAVPGSKGSYVYIVDAVKKALPSEAPFPAGIKGAGKAEEAAQPAEEAPAEEAPEQAVEEAQSEEAPVEEKQEEPKAAEEPSGEEKSDES